MSGLSLGMLLFLTSSRLSLIFGLAPVVNVAHGSFYLLGAYVGITTSLMTGSFVVGLVAATIVGAIVGVIIDRVFLTRVPDDPLGPVLITFRFLRIIAELCLQLWGGHCRRLAPPAILTGLTSLLLGVVHTYHGPSHVLRGVSLSVETVGATCLFGRNGAKKTTLVHTVMGLQTNRKGMVLLDGNDITRLRPHHRCRLGMALVPQGRRVFGQLTVLVNLQVAGRWASAGREGGEVENVFKWFPRLRERLNQRARTLSGGEQPMLAARRALIGAPHVLLLDEPSEGLAPTLVNQLSARIHELKEASALAIPLVEQQINFALNVADRGYVMEKGTIVHEGAASELRSDRTTLDRYLGIA